MPIFVINSIQIIQLNTLFSQILKYIRNLKNSMSFIKIIWIKKQLFDITHTINWIKNTELNFDFFSPQLNETELNNNEINIIELLNIWEANKNNILPNQNSKYQILFSIFLSFLIYFGTLFLNIWVIVINTIQINNLFKAYLLFNLKNFQSEQFLIFLYLTPTLKQQI